MIDFFKRPKGIIEITEKYTETGEVIRQEVIFNTFLRQGMTEMIRAFTDPSPAGGSTSHIIRRLKIGDDFGGAGFTEMNPQPATPDFTNADQNVVFTVEPANITVNYPNFYSVEYLVVLDGGDVMDQFPDDVDKRYSSAALYTDNDTAIAFRRFETRTITRQITVDIKWTLLFEGEG